MTNRLTRLIIALSPLLIFFLTLGVYIKTLAPTISTGDSGELITAAATLGIPHAPGYPLYTLIGHLFSLLPINTIAWRLNFMSAIFMSAAMMLFYLLSLTILRLVNQGLSSRALSSVIAISVTFILAFSYPVWRYAVVADVFSMNLFFSTLSIFILLRWLERNRKHERTTLFSNLYFSIFILSLGLTNHHSIVLLIPAFLYIIIKSRSDLFFHPTFYGKIILIGILALSPYMYLPPTAAANPILNWGNPVTIDAMVRVLLRSDYGTFFLSPMQHSQTLTFNSIMLALFNFGKEIVVGSNFLILLFFPIGLIRSFRQNRFIGTILLLSFFLSLVTFLFLGDIQTTEPIWGELIKKFYILPYLPLFILTIVGADLLMEKLVAKMSKSDIFLKTFATIFCLVLLSTVPLLVFLKQYPKADQSGNTLVYDFGNNIISSIEPGGLFLSYGENNAFSLLYLLYVENQRPDITLVDQALLSYPWYKSTLSERYPSIIFPSIDSTDPRYITEFITLNMPTYPIYFESLSNLIVLKTYDIEPHGLVRKIIPFDKTINYTELLFENERLYDAYRKDNLSIYDYPLYSYEGVLIEHWIRSYQALGNVYFSQKDYENAEKNYRLALEIWPQHEDVMNSLETVWKEKRNAKTE